jgi:hypothetical protein
MGSVSGVGRTSHARTAPTSTGRMHRQFSALHKMFAFKTHQTENSRTRPMGHAEHPQRGRVALKGGTLGWGAAESCREDAGDPGHSKDTLLRALVRSFGPLQTVEMVSVGASRRGGRVVALVCISAHRGDAPTAARKTFAIYIYIYIDR